jgi:class 3 adenylate cyclase
MSWNEQISRERVRLHIKTMGEIEVMPLKREVTDIEAILSETVCREIIGAHVYCDVTNFNELSSNLTMKRDAYQRLIQSAHIYEREVNRIGNDVIGAYHVHFQGAKLHALVYLPIANESKIAIKAVMLLLVLDDFVKTIFNNEFNSYLDWSIGGGGDLGVVIGTRNGKVGEREMLFIGNPANRAAKIIPDRSSLHITKHLYDFLPNDLKDCGSLMSDGTYKLSIAQKKLDMLCSKYGFKWDRTASADRLAKDREAFSLAEVEYSEADVAIDFASLGWKNSKRVFGASIFADVSGFTRFVEDAVADNDRAMALKVFHVIRKELTTVAISDYNGVHVQFQGDRSQVMYHLPKDDAGKVAVEAIEAAIGLQSSFEQVIKVEMPEVAPLALKIGIDMGTTLASRLGPRGDRDNICLGVPVQNAANIEERCGDSMIGISRTVFGALEGSDLQKHFKYEKAYDCWVARGLTWDKIDADEDEMSYTLEKALTIGVIAGATGVAYAVSEARENEKRQVQPSRTYGP